MIISGARLGTLTEAYFSDLYSGPVAPSAEEALRRIILKYGALPNKWGTDNADIVRIRNLLHNRCNDDQALANGFVIYAPHTHWDPRRPIIIWQNATGDVFEIGNKQVPTEFNYLPVSFVFRNMRAIPYEWLELSHDSNVLDVEMHSEALSIIDQLCEVADGGPFGISVHFKFKPIFSRLIVPTQEINEGTLSAVARLGSAAYDSKTFEQVGWHAISDRFWCDNGREIEVLNRLRGLFAISRG